MDRTDVRSIADNTGDTARVIVTASLQPELQARASARASTQASTRASTRASQLRFCDPASALQDCVGRQNLHAGTEYQTAASLANGATEKIVPIRGADEISQPDIRSLADAQTRADRNSIIFLFLFHTSEKKIQIGTLIESKHSMAGATEYARHVHGCDGLAMGRPGQPGVH